MYKLSKSHMSLFCFCFFCFFTLDSHEYNYSSVNAYVSV